MGYTQLQVEQLQAAIASGAKTVQYADQMVTYQDTNRMLDALAIMKRELGIGQPQNRRVFAGHSKGILGGGLSGDYNNSQW